MSVCCVLRKCLCDVVYVTLICGIRCKRDTHSKRSACFPSPDINPGHAKCTQHYALTDFYVDFVSVIYIKCPKNGCWDTRCVRRRTAIWQQFLQRAKYVYSAAKCVTPLQARGGPMQMPRKCIQCMCMCKCIFFSECVGCFRCVSVCLLVCREWVRERGRRVFCLCPSKKTTVTDHSFIFIRFQKAWRAQNPGICGRFGQL